MKNPNLVPKQITDKNGVSSVRWTRPDQTATPISSLPAPAPIMAETPSPADRETVERAASIYVKQVTYYDDDADYIEDTLETTIEDFSSYPACIIEDITLKSSNPYGRMWGLKDLLDSNAPEGELRDFLNLFDYVSDNDIEGAADPHVLIPGVAAHYEGLEPVTMTGSYPEKRRDQLKGLLGGASRISEMISKGLADAGMLASSEEYDVAFLTDKRLSDLFITRSEDHGIILVFMDERQTVEYDRIMEHLNSSTPAMASGTL